MKTREEIFDLIEKYGFSLVLEKEEISEDIIREFIDNKMITKEWEILVQHQKLSEDFIREFKDVLNMRLIFLYQKNLSSDFIYEFLDDFRNEIIIYESKFDINYEINK